ncbi:hypothetical protein L6R52_01955 [Myxococcota bacterium]|nr:hypothetical protein [Myxococcota bacterium]
MSTSPADAPGGVSAVDVKPASPAPASSLEVQEVLRAVSALTQRIAELEDAVAEAAEEIGKVRKAVSDLKHSAASKKQVKKLKKVLDQLEVIEVGPESAPAESGKLG